MPDAKAKKSETKRPDSPAKNPQITVTRSTLVSAFRLWRQDDMDGKCEAVDHPEQGAQRDADALLDYIRVVAD